MISSAISSCRDMIRTNFPLVMYSVCVLGGGAMLWRIIIFSPPEATVTPCGYCFPFFKGQMIVLPFISTRCTRASLSLVGCYAIYRQLYVVLDAMQLGSINFFTARRRSICNLIESYTSNSDVWPRKTNTSPFKMAMARTLLPPGSVLLSTGLVINTSDDDVTVNRQYNNKVKL